MHTSKRKNTVSSQNADIIGMLDNVFDEDIGEISEISEFDGGEASGEAEKRNTFHMAVGVFFIVMAVIGIISTINMASVKISDFLDNTDQKNEFAKFVYPVVICDPPSFDENTRLRNETIISAAIWDIILYEDKSRYSLEFDYLIVPEVDVEQHALKLFGSGQNLTHTTISSPDISFYYDEEISSYRIPENPKFFTYSPYIEEITKTGNTYTLTVGYVSPTPAWLTLTTDEAPMPEKYVEYVVVKNGDSYTLSAVQPSDKKPLVGHDSGL